MDKECWETLANLQVNGIKTQLTPRKGNNTELEFYTYYPNTHVRVRTHAHTHTFSYIHLH